MSNTYLSLVVCGKRLRSQWRAESERFFPEAKAELIEAKSLERDLPALVRSSQESNTPLVAIVSYETVTRQVETLCDYRWDDLIVDEAVVLKNPSSQRCQALWQLRPQAERAVALTGTPIERDLDDLGAILAWTRGDREMFHGERLSKRFDATDPDSVSALWDTLGPTVFRRDRSEIADELPQVQTETILLDPEPAERKLADAARNHLREILDELTGKIEQAAELDPNDPAVAEAKEELAALRGAALGGVTLARMAACDPAAVAASESVGAALLDSKGLVAPAVQTGGTKRQQIVGVTQELVEAGESVLIFTDFSSLADNLVADLTDAGVRVGCIKGGMTDRAAQDAQDGFQGAAGGQIGDDIRYDCLVLTKTAREGLNLQRASVLIHYDLPWKASDMVQRVGRASRIGSTAETLQVLIPVMAGTIEERAAKKLVQRAVTALAVLDNPRGVDTRNTEMAQALTGLQETISEGEMENGDQGVISLARELIG